MCSAGSALVEGDRGGGADGLALPLVAGILAEGYLQGVRPRLVGAERSQGNRARCQLRCRSEGLVARHTDLELVGVRVADRGADPGDGVAQRHVRGDTAGVRDREVLRLRLARLQVAEVEVEAAAVLRAAAQVERQRRRRHVDTTGVAGREVRAGDRHEQEGRRDAECSDAAAGTSEVLLGDGLQGHGVPLL